MRRLFLLFCALLGAGCSRPGAGRIDPALASLVPADTVLLAGARVEKLRATPLFRNHPDLFERDFARTGLDARNLYEVLLASDGQSIAVLARGKFAPADGSEPRVDWPDATRTPYKGYTLIGSGGEALAFMNPSTAVAGAPEAVRRIIDQRGRSTGIPPALETPLASIPPEHQVWVVSLGQPPLRSAPSSPLAANAARALAMTESVVAGVDLRQGVNGFATLTCRNEQDATDLAEAAKAMVSLARLAVSGNRPDVRRAWQGLEITQQQRTVRLTLALSQADLDTLLR